MLKVFRDSMKYLAWVLWAVIAVFVLFVFVDFGSVMPSGVGTQSAATVGDDTVTYREFQREYRDLEQQMKTTFGDQYNPELAEQLQLPLQALDRVINRKILLTEADRMDLTVTNDELRDYILTLGAFKDAQGAFVGGESYDRAVRRLGFTPESFETQMREELLVQRVLNALERAFVVSEQSVEDAYREQTERATIRFSLVPFSRSSRDIEVTEEAIEDYFAAHREELELPEQRRGQYLLIETARLQQALEISDEDKRAYYDENKPEFTEQEQVHARHILVHAEDIGDEAARSKIGEARARLENGEPFETVAKEMSDEPSAQSRGGDLGWFGRGRMVKPFEDAAFGAPVGQLVGPLLTQFGYHLIEVVERRDGRQRPFEEVEASIQSRLAAQRSTDQAEAMARDIHNRLVSADIVTAADLETAATEFDAVQFGTTEPFQRQGAITPLGSAPNLNLAAFELETGALTQPVRTPRGWAVLRLEEVEAPHLPELDEVRIEVERATRLALLEEATSAKVVAAITEGLDLDALSERFGVKPRDSQEFGPGGFIGGLGVHSEIADAAFELDLGILGGPFVHNNNVAVIEVIERTDFDPVAFDQERDRVRQELERQELNAVLGSFIKKRRRELDVHYDNQLLESFGLGNEADQEI